MVQSNQMQLWNELLCQNDFKAFVRPIFIDR